MRITPMTDEYADQPPIADWKFIEELKSPLHNKILWRRLKRKKYEATLQNGVTLDFTFPDPDGKLNTAYADFCRFLWAGQIATGGKYKITTELIPTSCFEEYVLEIGKNSCKLSAGDTEGIRRALVCLEDRITSTGGPFIAPEKIQRKPFIKTRISRCFFGPIKRPPLNRDELLDNVNYYPDEYLNRLAHEGINGLWLSIEFRDLCPSRFFPEHGKDAPRRLEKLQQTVKQCARYGIKIYIFFNEPLGFGRQFYALPPEELENHGYFSGHRNNSEFANSQFIYFCTSTPEGQEYLESCTNYIFSHVPGLGGAVAITHGEYPTHCYSYTHTLFNNNCPRCSKRKPWEVYHDTLSALLRGIKKAAPDAEFISWLYAPGLASKEYATAEQQEDALREIAAHTPTGVTMQLNFESNGKVKQLGRTLTAYDYWLAWPGPSDHFKACAAGALKAGAGASAKIQVGNSHEDATIPFMPVPGSLYRKYQAMQKIGVSSVMQCWYFGNYPGLMNKAAGELSFLPFPEKESDFLRSLAQIDWAGNHRKVARAWQYFMKGYAHFPITLSFTWFGPLHCSIVWPLHLFPVDQPIAPSWEFGYPDSGDRIGECIGFKHSLDDILVLLGRMDDNWRKGVAILDGIAKDYADNPERQRDINLCRAIGLQIRSSRNIFRFYDVREKLPFMTQNSQNETLRKMAGIVREEIDNTLLMKNLCLNDPRLGFHSEAEGYKFFPAKLARRAGLLATLLEKDFPKVQRAIAQNRVLFPKYTGATPVGKAYYCSMNPDDAAMENFTDGNNAWQAWNDGKNLCFNIKWQPQAGRQEFVKIEIEPRRLWPIIRFEMSDGGNKFYYGSGLDNAPTWQGAVTKSGKCLIAAFAIPFKAIPWFDGKKPLRINICRTDTAHKYLDGWITPHPLKPRLLFETHNSADLGWVYPVPPQKTLILKRTKVDKFPAVEICDYSSDVISQPGKYIKTR